MINSLHYKCFSGLLPWWYRGDVIYPVNNYSFLASVIKHFIGSETCLVSSKHTIDLITYCSGFCSRKVNRDNIFTVVFF